MTPASTIADSDIEIAPISWRQLCEDPRMRDWPYRIETDKLGRIIMTPTRNTHGRFQNIVARLLEKHKKDGETLVECAIRTNDGTKVTDVAWFSNERWPEVKDDFDSTIAPEICIEVLSTSNTDAEINHKKQLYFEAAAEEFWLCDLEGNMQFFDQTGETEKSKLVPNFPGSIK